MKRLHLISVACLCLLLANGVSDAVDSACARPLSRAPVVDSDPQMLRGGELIVDRVKPCGRFFLVPEARWPDDTTDAVRAFDRSGSPAGVFLRGRIHAAGGNPVFARDGNLIFSQSRQDRILVMDPAGGLARIITGGGLNGSRGLALDNSGDLAVCSYFTDSVKFFSPTGDYIGNLAHAGTQDPHGVAYDRAGNLFVASRNDGDGRVAVFDLELNFVRYIGEGLFHPHPQSLAFDTTENLYATSPEGVLKFSHDGTFLDVFSHPDLYAHGVALDDEGRLYVTNFNAHEVFVFNLDGVLLGRLPIDMGSNPPSGLYLYGIAFETLPDTDCNENGTGDACDIESGESTDCNFNAYPDECELEGNDCNANKILDECEADCNENEMADECDIRDGFSFDFDNNGVPDECQPDCNDNGFPDFIDIAFFFSLDCNVNDVPDECDVAGGASSDCNFNEIPDECDVADGFSYDCDADQMPDECEPDTDGDAVPDDCDQKGDFDHNVHVDLIDYQAFEGCLYLSGPGELPLFQDCLDAFDFDDDDDVDLADFAGMQSVFGR